MSKKSASKQKIKKRNNKEETTEIKSGLSPIKILNSSIQEVLAGLGYESLTKVQNTIIPEILSKEHKDILCISPKNSGKMFSFLLPILSKIIDNKLKGINEKFIIITGTKERAEELYSLSKEILRDFNGDDIALCIGGANRKKEVLKLMDKKIKLIISTPQRIVEYAKNDKNGKLQLKIGISKIILDKLENMEKNGYINELKEIFEIYGFASEPKNNSNIQKEIKEDTNFVIFLESKNEEENNFNINELLNYSGRKYKKIIVEERNKEVPINNEIIGKSYGIIKNRGYIILDPSKKFLFLLTFLRKNTQKKFIVFFATNKEVIFFKTLLGLYHIETTIIDSGSTKNIKENQTIINEFSKKTKGILLCTDLYKMKLNLPLCDWIIFYDSPPDIETFEKNLETNYINSSADNIKAFMILMPSETDLLKEKSSYNITQFNLNVGKIDKDQNKVEKYVNKKEHSILVAAFEAYRAYLFNYISRRNKKIFDLGKIDVTKLCKSFGFDSPPFINFESVLNLEEAKENKKKKFLFPEEIEKIYGNN